MSFHFSQNDCSQSADSAPRGTPSGVDVTSRGGRHVSGRRFHFKFWSRKVFLSNRKHVEESGDSCRKRTRVYKALEISGGGTIRICGKTFPRSLESYNRSLQERSVQNLITAMSAHISPAKLSKANPSAPRQHVGTDPSAPGPGNMWGPAFVGSADGSHIYKDVW